MKVLRVLGLVVVSLVSWVNGIEGLERKRVGILSEPTYVGLTLITNAASKGAVCMDGSLPGYHLHRGWGSGANSWLVHLDGGGWCNDIPSCVHRKKTLRGSSNYMEKEVPFTGIVSDKPQKNPDFFNWNRVKVRYCDGGSFTGEGENNEEGLYFRGQRIWSVVMEELMWKGMNNADQALLSGCSAGGLAVIQHCDEFSSLFPGNTKVKCLSDAGMFLDAVDVAGERRMKSLFEGVVNLRGSGKTLPTRCTSRMDGVSCFFPQNVLPHIQTPTFILNSAYDAWQFKHGLATGAADPQGHWLGCKHNHSVCDAGQLRFLHGFRNQMLDAVEGFSMSKKNGLFINSCFSHCHSERQDTWLASDSPQLEKKAVATSVGNWYFDRSEEKLIDCKYPCDNTCRHMVSNFRDKQKLRQPRLEISF